MKGLLFFTCIWFMVVCLSIQTFPNDMFYHHHPDLIGSSLEHFSNKYLQSNKDSQQEDYRPRYRPSYPPSSLFDYSPYRNGRYSSNNERRPHRGNSRYRARSIDSESRHIYNSDGSINWSNKASDRANQQDQRWPNNQDSTDYDYYRDYDYNSEYHQQGRPPSYYDDDRQRYSPYDRDYYNDRQNQDQPILPSSNSYYYDQNDNYDRSDYDDRYDYDYDNANANVNANANNRNNGPPKDKKYSSNSEKNTATLAGGIRLAGTLPDDGYHRGIGTFYDIETHVSSCGKQNKNTDFVAALNSEQMGTGGRRNPNCGKEVEITGPSGKTIQVTIVDECKTCKSGSLDLSPAAFEEIGEFSHGSIPIKWKFVQ
ncbi:uncharacterized protein BX663DRAFT_508375 [Cokeromyces recurvatus]|uniref:uncharacterized protein n=1 Tax=Cokeromyces recurvatus TaxID=90255 RepID=UPI00221F433F|nr:uncharacterized protein BX663DRAFT_508375 [Cokeromyces recurvatus]KAI7903369.1 hypothetical protein BX663DRAFT_508375 [Cokeromyces recurvatus]